MSAKAEGNDGRRKSSRTPFERFTEFTRRIVAVPKKELPAQEREFQRAKKKRRRTKQYLTSLAIWLFVIGRG